MSTVLSSVVPQSANVGTAKRSLRAGARSDRNQARGHAEKGILGLRQLLRHRIKDHGDAVANPGKKLLKVVPKGIVDKGSRDLARERQRADKLSSQLRRTVKRHDDAISQTGKRIQRLPSVKGLVGKGMQDIQTVASRTTQNAPLSVYSEIWTFPVALVTYSTMVIAWASELADVYCDEVQQTATLFRWVSRTSPFALGSTYSSQLCGTVGFAVGALFSAAHRAGTVRIWKTPSAPLNVVVTGGTRGIGRAIVREHLLRGDNVFIASRSEIAVREAVSELQEFTQRPHQVNGFSADVSVPGSVARLARLAQNNFPDKTIDVWINNAGVHECIAFRPRGVSGSFKSFLDGSPEDIARVARTNLLGALLCTRAAIKVMENQERVGHVFNMDGAGADGMATPQYAAYGATKAGIAQVMGSVAAECRDNGIRVGVHTLSPGMVLTDLILDGATNQNKQVFNILCEQPEVAAAYLVPRARSVAAREDDQTYIRFLTGFKALTKFMSAPFLLGRYFTNDGETAYDEDEAARLDSKATARAMQHAGVQGESLRYAYAVTLCAAVMVLSIDPDTVQMTSPKEFTGAWVTAMLDMPLELVHFVQGL